MTRLARGMIGIATGLVLLVASLPAAIVGWETAAIVLGVVGCVMAVGFLVAYDVDERDEAGVP